MSNNTTADVTGIFSLDTNRLVGLAAKGSPDVTYLACQDTPTSGIPLTVTLTSDGGVAVYDPTSGAMQSPARFANAAYGLPKVLVFGCSIAQQCNASLVTTTSTTSGFTAAKSKTLPVANGALFAASDRIAFPLYNARMYVATVESVAANVLTLTAPLPAGVRDAQAICKLTATQTMANLLQSIGAGNSGVILLGSPAEVLPAYGYGGALFREMCADLERDLRYYRPHVVIMHPYENDLCVATASGGRTLDELIRMTKWVTRLCLSYGATPVMCSSMPYYNPSPLRGIPASRKPDYYAILDYLTKPVSNGQSQYQIDFPGAYGVDLSTPWLDPAYVNDATYPCRPLPGWTDGVHPNTSKRFAVGANVEAVLENILPPAKSWLDYVLTPLEVSRLDGNTGAVPNMQAGSVAPRIYTIQAYGTAVATSTKNADGSLKIVATWPGAAIYTSDYVNAKYSFTFPIVWPGSTQRFKVYMRYRVNSSVGIAHIYPTALIAPGNDTHAGNSGPDMHDTHPTDGRIMIITTPHFAIGPGNTSIELSFRVAPKTAASPANAAVDMDILELGLVACHPETPHDWI